MKRKQWGGPGERTVLAGSRLQRRERHPGNGSHSAVAGGQFVFREVMEYGPGAQCGKITLCILRLLDFTPWVMVTHSGLQTCDVLRPCRLQHLGKLEEGFCSMSDEITQGLELRVAKRVEGTDHTCEFGGECRVSRIYHTLVYGAKEREVSCMTF